MNYRIKFADGTVFQQPETPAAPITPLKAGREWRRITVVGTVEAVKAAFVDGAQYVQAWDSVRVDVAEDGTETAVTEEQTHDLSGFSVAGEVVDHRDGTCTVLMGKPTELELAQAEAADATAALEILLGGAQA